MRVPQPKEPLTLKAFIQKLQELEKQYPDALVGYRASEDVVVPIQQVYTDPIDLRVYRNPIHGVSRTQPMFLLRGETYYGDLEEDIDRVFEMREGE
jgi:hypothetical protein